MPCLMDPPRGNKKAQFCPSVLPFAISQAPGQWNRAKEKHSVSTEDLPTEKAEVALLGALPAFLPLSRLVQDRLGLSLYGNATARESGTSSLFSL